MDIPFRTIVSERGSWLGNIKFLLSKLKTLYVNDPFRTKSSSDVGDFFRSNQQIFFAFSVDVEDLFCSVPHNKLLESVQKCIEDNGDVFFMNDVSVSVDNFLVLLEFYLNVTFITFQDKPYLQRQGICIRSGVAPVLCDIFYLT